MKGGRHAAPTRGPSGQLVRELRREGYAVEYTGAGHLRITKPGHNGLVFTASTPSCPRAQKNLWAQLRRSITAKEIT